MAQFVKGATLGLSGTVDFAGLVKGAGGKEWNDPDFRPDDKSFWIDPSKPGGGAIGDILNMKVVWKRCSQLSSKAQLFYDDVEDTSGDGGAEANDIIQGQLGDCYFLSALSILCTTKKSNLVDKLFVSTEFFQQGLVGVRFFKECKWWDVAVDTWLPCVGSRPVFARNKDPNEFWMSIIEKAYAKIHGSYESCDAGFMNESLVDLTGSAPGSVKILDLFASCMDADGTPNEGKALKLLKNRSQGILLQGASCDDGGSEEPLGEGLHSGHAYSINDIVEIQHPSAKGEVLIQLRNPWGGHEWTGKWNDKDSRWIKAIKDEVGQRDVEDGMFWMSCDDFARCFTTITFADLVPPSFCVIRAEGEWTKRTAGGCANHKSWKLNPQLIMKVTTKSQITIALSQPDSRMMFRTGQFGKEEFDTLYGEGTGYEESIGFSIWSGTERKVAYTNRGKVADAEFSALRTVSCCFDCEPGSYVIVPATFDPNPMKFIMQFWSCEKIELIDTSGGTDFKFFDASQDSILCRNTTPPQEVEHLKIAIGHEREPPPVPGISAASVQNVIMKADPRATNPMFLNADMASLGKGMWKCGMEYPQTWEHGVDFTMTPSSTFVKGEMCGVRRPDHAMRYAKVLRVNDDNTYDICTGVIEAGLTVKSGVPPQFICKLPHGTSLGGNLYPKALMKQVGTIFDCLDIDRSGSLDFGFEKGQLTGELANDLGRRFLNECQINQDDQAAAYEAMKTLDLNGDGAVDRDEFIEWMSARMVMLSTTPVGISVKARGR